MDTSDGTPPEIPVSTKTKLEPFFVANPSTEAHEQDNKLQIKLPWNDASLIITVEQNNSELVEVLNMLHLPPAFQAIKHLDTNDIEFIAGFIGDKELISRSFDIHYDNAIIRCEWADPSTRAIAVSRACSAIEAMSTQSDLRNTQNLISNIEFLRQYPKFNEIGRIQSFWIRNVDKNAQDTVLLCQHINFYMRYFDILSPYITIVEEEPQRTIGIPNRYPRGTFPSELTAFKIEAYPVDLWFIATKTTDPLRKFLHSFQILEYYAFYYLKNEIAEAFRKIVLKPGSISRLDEVASQLLELMSKNNMEDGPKLEAIIKEWIDPKALWSVIQAHRDVFMAPINFDGGFVIEALITDKTDF